ncbi:MAG: HEPN domain-containing protein [Bacteroidales bacterium]|jgi:HEPN domain-containing protein|nr:HEPN domain-containing protein [Bacteroidales bacterium]
MMNIEKQIQYWINGSNEDLITSELLIANNRYLHGLFWCHLTIEKSLKALVVKSTGEIPPKTHNLIWLLGKTDIQINPEIENLIGSLMVYQLEGRYPEQYPSTPSKELALEIFTQTKEFHQWLMKKL